VISETSSCGAAPASSDSFARNRAVSLANLLAAT